MLKMVDGTGIIGIDMICPLGVSTPQPPNYDKVETEGTGVLVLPNSLDAPLERLELGGKTEQVQTTGKNLFGGKILAGKYPTNDMNVYEDKTTTNIFDKPVEIKPDTEYIISADGRLVEGNIFIYDGSGKKIAEHHSGKFTSSSNAKYVVACGSNTYMTVNSAVQMEYGPTITPYEPYTGGKPSPSPEYPQEIKSVGKLNADTQKYEVSVKVAGKNLFDIEKAKEKSNWTTSANGAGFVEIAVYVGTGSTVTVSNNTKINNPGLYYYGVALKSSEDFKYFICYPGYPNSKDTHTFTATEDYIYVRCNKTSLNDVIGVCGGLQIEIGSSRTDFESYKEQSLTLTSDRPITKWDKLVEQGGQIGWLYGSKIYVVTGNEVFESRDGYNIESYTNRYFILNDLLMENDALKPLAYMKCLRNVQYVYSANIFEEGFETNKNQFHIKLCNDRVGILASDDHAVRTAKFSEYMKKIHKNGNPIEILYATTDTVFLPLPQSEQNAIRALKTYYPTTVITVDGGELDPDIKATYRKEI